tara:strand:+ start:5053 stop:5613 length:561 start_codon:yes stop_codon:yes gene_type:complete
LAIIPILEIPHPILRKRATKIRKIDKSIIKAAYNMVETLEASGGVGLAANQVGILKRIIVVKTPEIETTKIYFNPEIIDKKGERIVEEGCLSIPGYKGYIKRSITVKFGAIDHTYKTIKINADGLLSQIFEHEVDHLNGILFSDHLKEHEKLIPIEYDEESNSDQNYNKIKNEDPLSQLPSSLDIN